MKMSHKVLVVGTGTIGEPLIGLLAEHQKQLGLDDVLFFKRTPLSEEQGKVEALLRKGAKIVSTSDALNEFHSLGFAETSDVEQAYEDADVIIDCTPSGNENWDKIYSSLNQDKRFMAQGSEHGFGPFFAWGINNEVLEEESNKFLIASCNTHNIASIVKCFSLDAGRELEEGKFVCLRRANDVSQNDSFSPSPTITKHSNQEFGTHHARDVYELFSQEGKKLNLFSSAIKLPTQYMHTLWFSLAFKDVLQHEDIMKNLNNSEFLMATEKMSSNKVFSFGRDHGYHGRLLSHGIVAEQSLHVKENTLTGYCFTPQDGNALLSSVAGTVQYYYKDDWKEKMEIFNRYIFKNI
jgi:glyceraldehyde-3-phosphate dehydrogenase type II